MRAEPQGGLGRRGLPLRPHHAPPERPPPQLLATPPPERGKHASGKQRRRGKLVREHGAASPLLAGSSQWRSRIRPNGSAWTPSRPASSPARGGTEADTGDARLRPGSRLVSVTGVLT